MTEDSLCSAHIGVSKQRIRNVAKSDHDIDTIEQLHRVKMLRNAQNTTAIDLESMDRSSLNSLVELVPGRSDLFILRIQVL
jgi:hypothetical protein